LDVHRIDQQIGFCRLDEKAGVPDEGHDHLTGPGHRRLVGLDRDLRRPPRLGREQQMWHLPQWLAVRAVGIEVPVPIVIAG